MAPLGKDGADRSLFTKEERPWTVVSQRFDADRRPFDTRNPRLTSRHGNRLIVGGQTNLTEITSRGDDPTDGLLPVPSNVPCFVWPKIIDKRTKWQLCEARLWTHYLLEVLFQPRHQLDEIAGPVAGVELEDQDAVPGVLAGAGRSRKRKKITCLRLCRRLLRRHHRM